MALFKEQGCCNIGWQKPGKLQLEQELNVTLSAPNLKPLQSIQLMWKNDAFKNIFNATFNYLSLTLALGLNGPHLPEVVP